MISIIVPIYNMQHKLEKCIKSICNQTYSDIEIILVDDGSTDDSFEICQKYMLIDERIKVIRQENSGVSQARNIGIKNSNGDYIVFVDSDDYIESNMCQILIEESERYKADLVVCGYYTHSVDTITPISYKAKVYNKIRSLSLDFSELYIGCFFNSLWNKLYKREYIGEFDPKLSLGEDLLFNLDYLKKCSIIKTTDSVLYHYNINHNMNSLTHLYRENNLEIKEMLYMEMKNFCECNGIDSIYRKGMNRQYFFEVYYGFQQIVYYSKLKKKNIIQVFNHWLNKEHVINVVEESSFKEVQFKIARYLMKYKNVYLLLLMYKLKKILKKS